MKKLFYRTASALLGATFLLSPTLAFAEDYIPFSIQVGGTGATTVAEAKENLEIPEVVQTAGTSETVVMSQKAVTDAIAAGSGGGIVVTQASGQSTTDVMSQKAVTDAINSAQTPIVQTTGQSTTNVMSQKAVTDALAGAAQNTIVQTTGTGTTVVMSQKAVTDVMDTVIPKASIVNNIGTSTTTVMSQKAVTDAILTAQTIFNMIYPVGSIYMSVSSTNPGSFFGGTWVQWGNGRVPLGMGSNGTTNYTTVQATGGSETVTLTTAQIPSHSHRIMNYYPGGGSSGYSYCPDVGGGSVGYYNMGTEATGSGQAHNNLQPYITCYMWKRTA